MRSAADREEVGCPDPAAVVEEMMKYRTNFAKLINVSLSCILLFHEVFLKTSCPPN